MSALSSPDLGRAGLAWPGSSPLLVCVDCSQCRTGGTPTQHVILSGLLHNTVNTVNINTVNINTVNTVPSIYTTRYQKMTPLSSVLLSLLSLSQLAMAEEMSQPEQELLAKYLLQQLTSDTPDPILARLVREEEAGEILAGQQSQTIATIVPAPPGLSTAGSKQHETCESLVST